jgi:ankyrin repeat protein
MAAALGGNPEVISVLIKHGSNVNAVDDSGWTALTMPIFLWKTVPHLHDSMTSAITLLVENGIDVNIPDEDGTTLLMLAALSSEPRIVDILLNAGADINAKDKEGKSVVDYAQKNDSVRNSEIYKKLTQANSAQRTFFGWGIVIGLSLSLLLLCLCLIFFKKLKNR